MLDVCEVVSHGADMVSFPLLKQPQGSPMSGDLKVRDGYGPAPGRVASAARAG